MPRQPSEGAILAVDAALEPEGGAAARHTLVIACGALARELISVIRLNKWSHIDVTCLPAILHNRPERITAAVHGKIVAARGRYQRIVCLYGDCGTGGGLDAMLRDEGIERIEGDHCYAFYAGLEAFERLAEAEIGTFYLTDYLVRFFDRLIIEGLGIDRFPHLQAEYFRHYRRVVWLAQMPDETLRQKAEAAAQRLRLPLEIRTTGLAGLAGFLEVQAPQAAASAP
jgi:hypothetical protein